MEQNLLTFVAEVDFKPRGAAGEDALSYRFDGPALHAQAVFDGCGGSGAWKYPEFHKASGAFVSAHSMAAFFQDWVLTVREEELAQPELLAERFRQESSAHLKRIKAGCAPIGVSGSMVKQFPCTASIALMEPAKDDFILTALNAGDSRVYFLTPQNGLVQLTDDDSRGNPDPMRSLRESAALSNMLNADKDYKVRWRQVRLKTPCAVLCASDGMFGFLRSPMDFEHILLDALMKASTPEEFENRFRDRIVRVTGDDSTAIMSFYGFADMMDVKFQMKPRYLHVREIIRQMDEADGDAQQINAAIDQAWEAYKPAVMFGEWPK